MEESSASPVQTEESPRLTCQECEEKEFLYQCPRCSFRSCSLACCRAHKQRTSCNGKRNRTQFVSMSSMTDSNIKSDFHFLEDVVGKMDSNRRFLKQSGETLKALDEPGRKRHKPPCFGTEAEHPILQSSRTDGISNRCLIPQSRTLPRTKHQLQNKARSKGICLMLLPPFMERHKQNRTVLRKNILIWTVEWCLYSSSDGESVSSKQQTQIPETQLVWKELECLIEKGETELKQAFSLRIKKEPSPANHPSYVAIAEDATLLDALRDQTVMEFPTIHVVPVSRCHEFPLLVESMETNSEDAPGSDSNAAKHP